MHKFVLAAHSGVFSTMFQHKSIVENTQSRLKITDFNSNVVSQMLEYLYSGELPDELNSEDLAELLKIAEKYQLESLKSTSEEELIARLTL